MMKPLFVINAVGLTPSLLGENTPNLNLLIQRGDMYPLKGVFPALTTSAQATMLTGKAPSEHGIVGNGWYFRDLSEIKFWLQPNQLIQGSKVWQLLKQHHPEITVSQLFWWYNMYADVDFSITPRPHYPADGRKIPDLYSHPNEYHKSIESNIGCFPFFNFWGPNSNIRSSRWIVDCAIEHFTHNPTDLQFVYLPHLDYNLQRLGPSDPAISKDVIQLDHEIGRLIEFCNAEGAEILIVSEYGLHDVDTPIALNRELRKKNWLSVRESLGYELLDAGASDAFAVADHQIAHIYVNDRSKVEEIKAFVEQISGVEQVLDSHSKPCWGIDHSRSGDLIAVAKPNAWFSYYYWLEDTKRPDFANSVDIHRKPGYDPAELFIDPKLRFPKLRILSRLLQKKLGFRMLMDVVPDHADMVKGSHGRLANTPESGPLMISSYPIPDDIARTVTQACLPMEHIFQLILSHFGVNPSSENLPPNNICAREERTQLNHHYNG
ncbi:nucleotide pyrophosphatase/phosphodiesterase family protein [Vibrio diabolicus]|uniref:alkaline phosphatase family protein n=1 Tax=Vibrio diabolicus TaxID=50719 RepID=UPI003751539D